MPCAKVTDAQKIARHEWQSRGNLPPMSVLPRSTQTAAGSQLGTPVRARERLRQVSPAAPEGSPSRAHPWHTLFAQRGSQWGRGSPGTAANGREPCPAPQPAGSPFAPQLPPPVPNLRLVTPLPLEWEAGCRRGPRFLPQGNALASSPAVLWAGGGREAGPRGSLRGAAVQSSAPGEAEGVAEYVRVVGALGRPQLGWAGPLSWLRLPCLPGSGGSRGREAWVEGGGDPGQDAAGVQQGHGGRQAGSG